MIRIYHNPKCKKSREGLDYLRSKGVEFITVDYIKNGVSAGDLQKLLQKMNRKPFEIVRTQEDYYKKELKNRHFTGDEWIKILAENPKLIMRPIVEGKYKAVIAQPAQAMDIVLNSEK